MAEAGSIGRSPVTVDELRAQRVSAKFDTPGNTVQTKYLVLTEMRSGSSLVCDLLRKRGAGIPFEYLNPNYIADFRKRFGMTARILPLDRYFAMLCDIRTSTGGYFGVQCVHRDLLQIGSGDVVVNFLNWFDRILLFSRKNKLAQAVSIMRARQTGRWESGLAALPDRHEKFDPVLLSEIVERIYLHQKRIDALLASIDRPKLILEYETVRDSLEIQWGNVQAFLGIEPVSAESLESTLKRQADARSDEYGRRYIETIQGRDRAVADG